MSLPRGKHDRDVKVYYEVELGPAIQFVFYDPISHMLSIEAEDEFAKEGTYPITVEVVDEDGVRGSNPLNIILTIYTVLDITTLYEPEPIIEPGEEPLDFEVIIQPYGSIEISASAKLNWIQLD